MVEAVDMMMAVVGSNGRGGSWRVVGGHRSLEKWSSRVVDWI